MLALAYGAQQMRRAYEQPAWVALLKLPAFVVGIVVVHLCYRAVQFLVTFALT